MQIPYLNLKALNAPYETQMKEALLSVIDSGWYLFGHQVEAFEKEWADYCATKHCIACSNGLDALRLVLRAWIEMGLLHKGDEVIVPANTYIASILAVSDNGLTPVPVEPDEESYLISPANIRKAITPKTKALLPVHLYGQMCDMEQINAIAEEHGLLVLEDCAQSHGADRPMIAQNKRYRATNSACAYSFYPGKNLGAVGDAGAVCTDNEDLAEVVRKLAFYGSSKKYVHRYKGLNSRMDEVQAAVLRCKLPDLDNANKKRQSIASIYNERIVNPLVKLPKQKADHVYHIYPIMCSRRDELQEYLRQNGIMTLTHYPIPPHKQEAYAEWNDLHLPITERISQEELSLPLNQTLTEAEVEYIINVINEWK